MRELHFVIPGDLDTLTGGYIYDKYILDGLSGRGRDVKCELLANTFPFPRSNDLEEASQKIGKISDGSIVIIDGLALAPLAESVENHSKRLVVVGLVHHPLAEETGLTVAQKSEFEIRERRALGACTHVIVTSSTTAATLTRDYGVPRKNIDVIEPGVGEMPISVGSGTSSLSLLCVGTLTPRKGHKVLLTALASLRMFPWTLTCVGDLGRDKQTSVCVQNYAAKLGILNRTCFVGTLSTSKMGGVFRCTDLFVSASYYEGYGMAIAEALASGIPVVATGVGAVPVTVPEKAGLLVPAGDSRALASALRRFFYEPRLRYRLKGGARGCRLVRRSWSTVVDCMEETLTNLTKNE